MSFKIALIFPPNAKKISVRDLILVQGSTDIPDMSR